MRKKKKNTINEGGVVINELMDKGENYNKSNECRVNVGVRVDIDDIEPYHSYSAVREVSFNGGEKMGGGVPVYIEESERYNGYNDKNNRGKSNRKTASSNNTWEDWEGRDRGTSGRNMNENDEIYNNINREDSFHMTYCNDEYTYSSNGVFKKNRGFVHSGIKKGESNVKNEENGERSDDLSSINDDTFSKIDGPLQRSGTSLEVYKRVYTNPFKLHGGCATLTSNEKGWREDGNEDALYSNNYGRDKGVYECDSSKLAIAVNNLSQIGEDGNNLHLDIAHNYDLYLSSNESQNYSPTPITDACHNPHYSNCMQQAPYISTMFLGSTSQEYKFYTDIINNLTIGKVVNGIPGNECEYINEQSMHRRGYVEENLRNDNEGWGDGKGRMCIGAHQGSPSLIDMWIQEELALMNGRKEREGEIDGINAMTMNVFSDSNNVLSQTPRCSHTNHNHDVTFTPTTALVTNICAQLLE